MVGKEFKKTSIEVFFITEYVKLKTKSMIISTPKGDNFWYECYLKSKSERKQ